VGSRSPYLCNRCRNYIGIGERYDRRVYRVGKSRHAKRLMVEVEHAYDRDCPYEELGAMEAELRQKSHVEVAITMVMSSRLVAKLARNGDTIYETESYLEMRMENTSEPPDDAYPDDSTDSDDDIPF
jgi:hypothetical protein